MKTRFIHCLARLVPLLVGFSLFSGCDSLKSDGGDEKKKESKLLFWKKDKSDDEYTLAGGSLPDSTAEEQQLLDAAQQAAGAPKIVSEVPDRIDLDQSPVVEESGAYRSSAPTESTGARDRFSGAPAYTADSRAVPPSKSEDPPRVPSTGAGSPSRVSAGSSTTSMAPTPETTTPAIPSPRESGKEDDIRLLPEPRFPSGESIIPPGG